MNSRQIVKSRFDWLISSNNVIISNNTGGNAGGMKLLESDPILNNVIISDNTANGPAGGMYIYESFEEDRKTIYLFL